MLLRDITTEDLRAVLEPIWHTKSETARRLRARIERVLSAAKAAGLKTRLEPFFMPTIRGALLARMPWLMVDCVSCGLTNDLDLRVKPQPQYATVLMAARDIKCPRCNGHGRPTIEGLAASPRNGVPARGWKD
jgi:hypothetical protein